jgi:hypothetical protein
MKTERHGREFVLRVNVTELTTLYCVIEEERISRDVERFKFGQPDKIRGVLADFHRKVFELMEIRTPEEKREQSENFFQRSSTK